MVRETNLYPEKSTFKLDEVCAFTGLKPYTLKFWESEFPQIRPIVSSFGKKLYEERDLNILLLIKGMLFEEKLSLEDAKAVINERLQAQENLESQSEIIEEDLAIFEEAIVPSVMARCELEAILLEIKSLQSLYQNS